MQGHNGSDSIVTKLVGYFLTTLIIYFFLNNFSLSPDIDNIIRSAFISVIIYTIWRFIFNKWLWRVTFIKVLAGVKKPYLHGRWEGYLKSSHDNFKTQVPIVIEIEQTYKSTCLTYYDERALSRGLVTDFITEEGASPRLFCIYRNEPAVANQRELQMHYGTMILNVAGNAESIAGVYYNYYLQRGTYGELFVSLVNRKLKHGF